MYYQNLFNQDYINGQQYLKLLRQRAEIEQQIKFEIEQQEEISKMVKSLNDFFDVAQKIAPQYQKQASDACVSTICGRLYGNNK